MSEDFRLRGHLVEQAACWNPGPMAPWVVLQKILLDLPRCVLNYSTAAESQHWILKALCRPWSPSARNLSCEGRFMSMEPWENLESDGRRTPSCRLSVTWQVR